MGTQGIAGTQGATGPTGAAGQGVPTGGTAGQVLTKINATDYNTQWSTPSGGGSASQVLAVFKSGTQTISVGSNITLPDVITFEGTNAQSTMPTTVGTWTGNNTFTAVTAGWYSVDVEILGDNASGAIPMLDFNNTGYSATSYYGTYYGNTVSVQNPYRFRGTLQRMVYMAVGQTFQIRAASATNVYGPTLSADGTTYVRVVKLN